MSQTDLAKRVAPPDRDAIQKKHGSAFLVAVVAGGIASAIATPVVGIVVGVVVGSVRTAMLQKKAIPEYLRDFAKWNRQYLCLTCGSSESVASVTSDEIPDQIVQAYLAGEKKTLTLFLGKENADIIVAQEITEAQRREKE